MKKAKTILAGVAIAALTSCGALGTSGSGSGVGDILGSVLGAVTNGQTIGNVLSSVIGLDKPSQADLIGTWKYRQPGDARSSLIMGWFPCAAAVLGNPNAQGSPHSTSTCL